jgi:hypothetical protein
MNYPLNSASNFRTSLRICHIDTGYDPAHASLLLHIRADLQWNFVDGDPNDGLCTFILDR